MENIEENKLSGIILDACIRIHRALGPGLLENAYEECLCYELKQSGIPFERQKPIPIRYNEVSINVGYRADIIVNNKVIIELKSVQRLEPVHFSQIATYLKLTELKLGLLINFNENTLIKGFHRIVNKMIDEKT